MRTNKHKPTDILCFEDFINYCIIAHKNDLLISNTVPPELVEKFIERVRPIIQFFDWIFVKRF
ncbi:MAG: hypothetical protein IJ258_02720 [Methanobrevibacter sp.]|uniref:hypothetical protein n=1 Tax=Methanobrevibacter sp. TaxID=66852 RepID=UPI0025E814ED|nr:hypothetical protein [Methanobrevibacter sp.]MBQ8016997.1 hypothetical protein [Methanobrevibacter sp.]